MPCSKADYQLISKYLLNCTSCIHVPVVPLTQIVPLVQKVQVVQFVHRVQQVKGIDINTWNALFKG